MVNKGGMQENKEPTNDSTGKIVGGTSETGPGIWGRDMGRGEMGSSRNPTKTDREIHPKSPEKFK